MNDVRRAYSEELKRHIVEEIEAGKMSLAEAGREYSVGKSLVRLWVTEYGRFRPKRSIIEVVMKSEKEKISELEKALAEAHLKLRIYDEMIRLANKKYKTDLKKNFGTDRLETYEAKGIKPRRCAKR